MKWIVLILVVGGLVLASGPALAQDNQASPPPGLWQQYLQEEAKYLDLIQQWDTLVAQYQAATIGKGNAPQFPPGSRRLIGLILEQGKKLEALELALAAQGQQSGPPGPPPGQP